MAVLDSGSANAGAVQLAPLGYLQTIFNQPSVLAATGNKGLAIHIKATKVIRDRNLGTDVSNLNAVYSAAGYGAQRPAEIPIFYVDSFHSENQLGLGFVNFPGVALLTSYQETLRLREPGLIPIPCYDDPSETCFLIDPGISPTDVVNGWFASAALVAHEIGHNLGLSHSFQGLMNPVATPYNGNLGLSSYALAGSEVQQMLFSQSIMTASDGQRFITLQPFSVLGVPEPATWLYMVVAFGFCGVAMRRANVRLASR